MSIHRWLTGFLLLLLASKAPASEMATVNQSKVNVRGQPALAGEVITQLNKGDQVSVLEEITVEKPKAGEPAKWAKIKMPANTPVWVFASFVDSASKTVSARRLNLRAGPGENYSSIGRLQKGDPVKEIRVHDDWMEVETPEAAFAFVAASCLDRSAAATAVPPTETKAPEPPPAQPVTQPTAVVIPPPPQVVAAAPEPTANTAAAPALDPAPAAAAPKEPDPQPAAAATPVESKPALAPPPAEAKPEPKTDAKPKNESPTKRIVRREGIVRSTASIQAPTYTELISPETRRTINWLHEGVSGIKLKDYRGKRVVVTGEEGIDPRWPKTPVIEVETIDLAP